MEDVINYLLSTISFIVLGHCINILTAFITQRGREWMVIIYGYPSLFFIFLFFKT